MTPSTPQEPRGAILPAVEPARGFSDADLLRRRTEALNRTSAENERLRAKVSQYERDLNITGDEFDVADLRAEVERLRAIVRDVEALADKVDAQVSEEWDFEGCIYLDGQQSVAHRLRAILARSQAPQAPAEQESYPDAEGLATLRANEAAQP